ncbi:hypothetical protein SKAU_G00346510 [Synaphobranchus kaupii]|uniref:Uncharacterized protein n=1 Tax=Synaphobranchus kaupii TaxID=118154 RepID=A0A9Q1IFL6_SYNKA|nr:hypothetical protein SKAU_G00346510 [Synaphobranchus kaupii]
MKSAILALSALLAGKVPGLCRFTDVDRRVLLAPAERRAGGAQSSHHAPPLFPLKANDVWKAADQGNRAVVPSCDAHLLRSGERARHGTGEPRLSLSTAPNRYCTDTAAVATLLSLHRSRGDREELHSKTGVGREGGKPSTLLCYEERGKRSSEQHGSLPQSREGVLDSRQARKEPDRYQADCDREAKPYIFT